MICVAYSKITQQVHTYYTEFGRGGYKGNLNMVGLYFHDPSRGPSRKNDEKYSNTVHEPWEIWSQYILNGFIAALHIIESVGVFCHQKFQLN